MLPDSIEFRVSSIKLDDDVRAIKDLMSDLESMVHMDNAYIISKDAIYGMGWYFYELSMSADLVKKLLNMYGREIMGTKGKKVEHTFTNWLMKKLKEYGCNARLKLKTEKEFRGFWPWLLK